jgi:ATP synthase protein I
MRGFAAPLPMNEDDPEPLARLDARLKRLKGAVGADGPVDGAQAKGGYGLAFTLAADLLGGLIGGTLLGWGIDSWLETAPWGLILFFFVGAAVGMWSVYRTVRAQDAAMGFHNPQERANRGRPPGRRKAADGGTDEGQEG